MKRLLIIAALLGFLAVALGALGAHALKGHIDNYQLEIFEKGVRYQFYHVLAIIAVAVLYHQTSDKIFYSAGILFMSGIILFSGSLYILAIRKLSIGSTLIAEIMPVKLIGPVTPIGGLLFLAGWMLLFLGAMKIKK